MTLQDKARAEIAALLDVPLTDLDDHAPLFALGLSSFRIVELVIELQEIFGIRFCQDDMNAVATVGDLVALIARRAGEGSAAA